MMHSSESGYSESPESRDGGGQYIDLSASESDGEGREEGEYGTESEDENCDRSSFGGSEDSSDDDEGARNTCTFHPFLQLPAELRIRVWEYFCPDLLAPARVWRVSAVLGGLLVPDIALAGQTRRLRRVLAVHRESRGLGLAVVPDTLAILGGRSAPAVLRMHAGHDIVHFVRRAEKQLGRSLQEVPEGRYAHVENIAVDRWWESDDEKEVEEDESENANSDSYHNAESGGDASQEKVISVLLAFWPFDITMIMPKLQRLYTVERATVRQANRWVGGNQHEEYSYHHRSLDAVYCWHAPWRYNKRAKKSADIDKDIDNDRSSFVEERRLFGIVPLKDRGIRFYRMLIFEDDDVLERYGLLKSTCKDGLWPVDELGWPLPDSAEDGSLMDEMSSEYGGSFINDEDDGLGEMDNIRQSSIGDDSGSDGSGNGDGDSDSDRDSPTTLNELPFSPIQSGDEQPRNRQERRGKRQVVESDEESEGEVRPQKRQRRRVLEEEEEEGEEEEDEPVKRRDRRTRVLDEDEEEEEEEEEKKKEKDKKHRARQRAHIILDSEEEDGEDEDEENEENEEENHKPLTLMQRLQLGRNQPLTGDWDEGEDEDEDEDERVDYNDSDDDNDDDNDDEDDEQNEAIFLESDN